MSVQARCLSQSANLRICDSPHKEQAKTHAINKTCIKKHHVAYCPNCYNLVSYLYGCSVCKYKGTELEDKRPLDYLDIVKYRKAQGLLGPRGLHARTADESTEGQDEEGNQDSDHDDDNDPDELYGAMARLERMLAKEETEEATTPIQANPNQPARRRRRANEI